LAGLRVKRFKVEVVRCDSERPASIAIDDIPVIEERGEQVVGRRSRYFECRGDGRSGNASALSCEKAENTKRAIGGGNLHFVWHTRQNSASNR
jgi:hypothetical protein